MRSEPRPADAPLSSPRRPWRAPIAIWIAGALVALLVLLLMIGTGLSNWRGSGFRAEGPELPRLRDVLALKPGMSVADVGSGNGELTVALAAEVGVSGR